jgi:hypothetical protein
MNITYLIGKYVIAATHTGTYTGTLVSLVGYEGHSFAVINAIPDNRDIFVNIAHVEAFKEIEEPNGA